MYRTAAFAAWKTSSAAGGAAYFMRRAMHDADRVELIFSAAGARFAWEGNELLHVDVPHYRDLVRARDTARDAAALAERVYSLAHAGWLSAHDVARAAAHDDTDAFSLACFEHGVAWSHREAAREASERARAAVRIAFDALRGDDGHLPRSVAMRVRGALHLAGSGWDRGRGSPTRAW
jgi:hypothetical protein